MISAQSPLLHADQETGRQASVRAQEALLCDIDLPFRRSFYPLGFEIEILTNHLSLLDAAEESFGHNDLRHGGTGLQIRIGITEDDTAECPPEPIRREYDHLYLLAADRSNQAL